MGSIYKPFYDIINVSELTGRSLCGGDWRICGVDDGVRGLHLTGGVAVVELDAVQGGVTGLGLVTAVGDFKDELEGEMLSFV